MKIVNPKITFQTLERRRQRIDQEIRRINEIMGFDRNTELTILSMSDIEKIKHIDRFQPISKELEELQRARDEAQTRNYFRDAGFKGFTHLPAELRIKIWTYAMESDLQPRVHCVKEKNGNYLSNQAISPLLAICSESRTFYIAETKSTFAFETYINFKNDIIYIPFFRTSEEYMALRWQNASENATQEASTSAALAENDTNHPSGDALEESSSEVHVEDDDDGDNDSMYDEIQNEPSFKGFLESSSAAQIQRLAMRFEFFTNIPLAGHMSDAHKTMQKYMPSWHETYVVFEDRRLPKEKWLDTEAGFKDLSARQKRARAERSYAREYSKWLNSFMEHMEVKLMNYRFCFVERGDEMVLLRKFNGIDPL